jgi:predicted TPR repeat methyltransferase
MMVDTLAQARSLFFEGTAHFESGQFDAARDKFVAALALAPGRPSIQANLGVTLFRLGQWAEAVQHLEPAVGADPEQPDAWLALGLSRKALALWPDALEALKKGLSMGAGTAEAWLALAHIQERLGAESEALASVERAITLDDTSAAAWSAHGGLLLLAHRDEEAVRSFERALALGADESLHRFYLASVRGDATPAQPPRAYVETLFDQYAGNFEQHLTQVLRYCGHETLLQPLVAAARHYPVVLDLGCGSGLCARVVRGLAGVIDGVDLSGAMVEQARATGLYRRVAHEDLLPFLQGSTEPVDLVMAADVFIYVGALEAVFAAVRRRLRAGGQFAFSVERHDGAQDLQLLHSMRYAHAPAYVERLAREHGFAIRRQWEALLRQDQDQPILGLYFHLEALD